MWVSPALSTPAEKYSFTATRSLVSSGLMGRHSTLLAWIGSTDLRAPAEEEAVGLGPVAPALATRRFDEAVLLSNYPRVTLPRQTAGRSSLAKSASFLISRRSSGFNLAASRYKPRVAEKAPAEDPARLVRKVPAIEKEIAHRLEKLLKEIEA